MPVIKSAQKQMRQAKTKMARNRVAKDAYRTKVKEVKKGIGVLDARALQEKLSESYKLIDKAAKKNILHKNAAARKKSKLAKMIKEGGGAKVEKDTAIKKKPAAKKK